MKTKTLKSGLLLTVALAAMMMLTGCLRGPSGAAAWPPATPPRWLVIPPGQAWTNSTSRPQTWASPGVIREKDELLLDQKRILDRMGIAPVLPKTEN